MPSYKAPVRETLFLLNDVFEISRYADLPGFADLTPETLQAMFGEAAKLAEDVVTPLNRVGDVEGCQRHPDASVTTPKGFREAYQQLVAGGWVGMSFPEEFGGQGLPATLSGIVSEFLASANLAFSMYSGLTQGFMSALLAHASPDIKAAYLPDVIAGKATGTMNLTEAHAGSDVGLSYTRARKEVDGTYRVTGSKVFISAGEHDLVENILHLVLARIEGAPAGSKGLSLFMVPKLKPPANGSSRERNGVSCGSIEKKMGIHGNATCVLNFDEATAWLIGEENRGLPLLFTMMNHARMSVGIQGVALAEVAYQNAAAYAKDRLQGRSLSGPKFPQKPADPIIVHGDVRRMLMTIRAFAEAGRALIISAHLRHDVATRKNDPAAVQDAEDYLALLTPVIKAFSTDRGFLSTVMAQQVYGGHGYIAENGMEQFVRDSRIPQIYEGTNGIQALDLAGRKLGMNDGRAVRAYFAEVGAYLKQHAEDPVLAPYVTRTREALGHLLEATQWLAKNGAKDRDLVGCGAWDYLHLFGLVALAHMWCRMAEAAQRKLKEDAEDAHLKAKLLTGRFFVERMLPETQLRLACVKAGGVGAMEMPAELF
jgi:acyl-CoA dehydrogenase